MCARWYRRSKGVTCMVNAMPLLIYSSHCAHTHTSQLLSAQLRTIHNSSTFIHTNSKFIWYQNKRSSKHRCNKFGACNCFELQLKHCLIYSYNLPFKYIQLVVRPDRRDSRAEKRWDCKHDTIKCGIRIKCQISHTHTHTQTLIHIQFLNYPTNVILNTKFHYGFCFRKQI